jgi:hypothetical protein
MQNIAGISQIKYILKVLFRVDICISCVLGRYLMNKTPVHKYLWDIYAMNYTILFVKTVFFLSIKWLFPSVHCWVHFHDIV